MFLSCNVYSVCYRKENFKWKIALEPVTSISKDTEYTVNNIFKQSSGVKLLHFLDGTLKANYIWATHKYFYVHVNVCDPGIL